MRIDDTGFGTLKLIQDPNGFCYGVDAVILADFAAGCAKNPKKAADLGTGTGIMPLLLSYMTSADEIWGVDFQESAVELAQRSVRLNGLEGRVKIICGDVVMADILQAESGSFDLVVSNPPYVKKDGGITNQEDAKRVARHETTAGIDDFVKTAARLLKARGDFCMVNRPNRLVDICVACRKYDLEPKNMRFVCPDQKKAPNLLLIHCAKGGRRELRMRSPLYIYEEDGSYTHEINKIYERPL